MQPSEQAQKVLECILSVLRAPQNALTYEDNSQTASVNIREKQAAPPWLMLSVYTTQGSHAVDQEGYPNPQDVLRKETAWSQEGIPQTLYHLDSMQ